MQKISEVNEDRPDPGLADNSGDDSDQIWDHLTESDQEEEEEEDEEEKDENTDLANVKINFNDLSKFGLQKEYDECIQEIKADTPKIPDMPEVEQENPPPFRRPRMKFGKLLPQGGGGGKEKKGGGKKSPSPK